MKIFLVEDNKPLNELLSKTLEKLGYNVKAFHDGQDAFDNLSLDYDLFIVDINLPQINGLELIKYIKKIDRCAKIIILSAEIDIEVILKAYDIGANDFVKKPFDIRELVAKIKNNFCLTDNSNIIVFENCGEYDKEQRVFNLNGKEIKLTKKEGLLLEILIKYQNKTVPNDIIENYVWPDIEKRGYVRQLVSKLRNKIPCKLIENHSVAGYRIIPKIIF